MVDLLKDHLMFDDPQRINLTDAQQTTLVNKYSQLAAHLEEGTYVRIQAGSDLLRVMIVGGDNSRYQCPIFYDMQLHPNFPHVPPYVVDPFLLTSPPPPTSWEVVRAHLQDINHDFSGHSLITLIAYLKKYLFANGQPASKYDNADYFVKSCKHMIRILETPPLETPPEHFEDIIHNYFVNKGDAIMRSIKTNLDGTIVDDSVRKLFKYHKRILNDLITAIEKNNQEPKDAAPIDAGKDVKAKGLKAAFSKAKGVLKVAKGEKKSTDSN